MTLALEAAGALLALALFMSPALVGWWRSRHE
jgi:hypothetical protein